MTTGFVQRFKGKVRAHILYLGSGGIADSVSGIAGKARLSIRVPIAVTAVANTDIAAISLPLGATLTAATVYTGTAFLAATDAKIEIGVSAGDASYVAQTSIKAVAVVALTLVNAAAAALASLPAVPNIFVRIVQTGAASATGAATLVLEYVMP